MEEEIIRRLNILNKTKVAPLSQRQLRGGMQSRLHRQEKLRYGRDVSTQKKKLQTRLSLIEQEKEADLSSDFESFSASAIEPLDDFHEPVFRKIRSRRGFFKW